MRRVMVVLVVVGLVLVASRTALAQAEELPVIVPVTLADGSVITVTVLIDYGGQIDDVAIEERQPVTYTLDDAKMVVATLADLPYGFAAGDEENPYDLSPEFNEDDAALGGWGSEWRNTQFSFLTGGNGLLYSLVVIYESPADVGMAEIIENQADNEGVVSVAEVSAPTMGDQSVALVVDYEDGDDSYSDLQIFVQLDNMVLMAGGRGFTGSGNFNQVLDLVERMVEKAKP